MNPYDRRESPEVEEQLRAEAEQCRNLRNILGVGFRPLQHEAHRQWAETFDDKSEMEANKGGEK